MVNELVRRHLRSYKYHGDPNVDRLRVAETIVKDKTSYEITSAQKIDPALVEQFLASWKDIFGQVGVSYSHDSSELFHQCREADTSPINTLTKTYREASSTLSQAGAVALAKVMDDAISLMQDTWHAEHDPEKFFKLIIADRQKGKDTIDKCKKVLDFSRNLAPTYKQIVDFVRDNSDNFTYLTDEDRESIAAIKQILTDEWPVDSMPAYKKRMTYLNGRINETREAIRGQIQTKYAEVYDELVAFANENRVPVNILPSLQNLIATKTGSSAISTLKLNLSEIDAFRALWMTKILEAKPADPGNQKKVRRVSSKAICKTPQSIKSDADIDAYVASIRVKLRAELGDNDELVIL